MIELSKVDTRAPKEFDKDKTKEATKEYTSSIHELQKVLYAQKKYSLLILLQGLDASGKDGVVSKVFSGINPLGCFVKAFKKPTDDEINHDFLWRVHQYVPQRGMIHIFNRSHYEDVLVPRVENWISKETTQKRFEHINHFENLLKDNDTIVLKFYLHISREEQLKRLQERKENPTKFWKHNDEDWATSLKWDSYMEAYEDVFAHCSNVPWHIVPSDQNWYKEYTIAKTISDAMNQLDLRYPGKIS
jgi:PPK2 family polyphosphate:nucleotide phosphotransferase